MRIPFVIFLFSLLPLFAHPDLSSADAFETEEVCPMPLEIDPCEERPARTLITSLGEMITFLYKHFAILPYVREAGMYVGNSLSGTSDEELFCKPFLATVGSHELDSDLKIYFTNGILNEPRHAEESAKAISSALGGSTIHYAYQPTRGLLLDCLESVASLLGMHTRTAQLLTESIQEEIARNPDVTILVIDHSQGNINSSNSLCSLSLEERNHIERVSFASPSYTPIDGLKSDELYVASKDLVPLLNPYKYLLIFIFPTPNTHILSSSWSNPISIHYLQGPVYAPALHELGAAYQDRSND